MNSIHYFQHALSYQLTKPGLLSPPIFLALCLLSFESFSAGPLAIETLLERSYLDDYHSNVVFGYRIVTETETYGARYTGNQLRCTNCHLNAGRKPDA
ncbi:MAG: hypothetical protein KZQ72_05755, partial [Candidatus Thiodiazotropha sp. (ex Cardiolucina cf. quadrata)]|nr:hypothetical protein [Candidatus Thiodiazotropha sp. (ex Cardiolucina cf. quadrata)]